MLLLNNKMQRGLRALAVFKAFKGFLVLFAGLALFSLIHQDIQLFTEQMFCHLHLNPAKHIPKLLLEATGNLTDRRIVLLALLAVLYSSIRLIEAYGLWFEKRWAEWITLVSGTVYLPIELYELAKGFSWLKIGFVLANLVIVSYMAVMLKRNGSEDTGIALCEYKP
ncbi:MAG: DUF2127 domain-containing protein [Chlorobium sp.]